MESFKLNVTDDREFYDIKSNDYAAAGAILSRYPRLDFVEETERENRLQVTLDLSGVEGIAGTRLNVVQNIVFAQTPITDNVDIFYGSLLRLLLRVGRARESQSGDGEDCTKNGKPNDAI